MAHAVQLTIGTSNKVTINYQSQEVSVSLTYELEREDNDVLAVARDKAAEVAAAHRIAWEQLRDAKVTDKKRSENPLSPTTSSPTTESPLPPVEPATNAGEKSGAENSLVAKTDVPATPLTAGQAAAIHALAAQAGWSQEQMQTYLGDQFGAREGAALSTSQAAQMLLHLQRQERVKAQARSQSRRAGSASSNGTSHPNPDSSNGFH